MYKRNIKKKIVVCVLCVLLLGADTIKVYAHDNDTRGIIAEEITDATSLLEDVITDDYKEKVKQVEEIIEKNEYDRTLSMESLYEKGSIFSNADYVSLIAAYITIANNTLSICDIDFFITTVTPKSYREEKPYKTYLYEDNGDGTYKRGDVTYITGAEYVPYYEEIAEDTYIYVEERKIEREYRDVLYGDIDIRFITPEELLSKYSSNITESLKEYEGRKEILRSSGISPLGLRDSIMLNTSYHAEISEDAREALTKALSEITGNEEAIIKTAASLLGGVPYKWGGKPEKAGYDYSWWTMGDDGEQRGLDCSGFVSWVYLSSGYEKWRELYSTGAILSNTVDISYNELRPGDIGLLNHGESVNHTGIYLGDGYFIHCASDAGTVTINKFPFTIFKRVPDIDQVSLQYIERPSEEFSGLSLSDEDIYLIAQTVSHEAKGQGINGWIAVTEVIQNRIESDRFPNTVKDVIYSPGQFEKCEEIELEVPSDALQQTVRATLDGNMRVINNKEVLFFRNPGDEGENDWGSHKAYMRVRDHVFYI